MPLKQLALYSGAVLALTHVVAVVAVDITAPSDPVLAIHQEPAGSLTYAQSPNVGATPDTNSGPGFPAAEGPSLAFDDNVGTKYLNFGAGQGGGSVDDRITGLVITPAVGLTVVTGLRLAAANDAVERDPFTVLLQGTNGDPLTGEYADIYSGASGLDPDPGRSQFGIQQDFANANAYSTYRLIFTTLRNNGTANSMQVGEVELHGTVIPEPTSLAFLALAGLTFVCRRNRLS